MRLLIVGHQAAVEVLRNAHNELLKVEVLLIEASSDLEVEIHRNSSVKDRLEAKRAEVEDIKREHDIIQGEAKKVLAVCQKLMERQDEAQADFLRNQPERQTAEELEADIESEKARLELMHEGNGGVIKEFEQRQKKIDLLKSNVADWETAVNELAGRIQAIRERWEPELDNLVKKISDSFSHNMKKINCAGEVGVKKDEDDFDQWAIQIQVKFRSVYPFRFTKPNPSMTNLLSDASSPAQHPSHTFPLRLIPPTPFLGTVLHPIPSRPYPNTQANPRKQRIRTPHPPRLAPPVRRRTRRLHRLLSHVPSNPHPQPLPRRRRNQPRHGSPQRTSRAFALGEYCVRRGCRRIRRG